MELKLPRAAQQSRRLGIACCAALYQNLNTSAIHMPHAHQTEICCMGRKRCVARTASLQDVVRTSCFSVIDVRALGVERIHSKAVLPTMQLPCAIATVEGFRESDDSNIEGVDTVTAQGRASAPHYDTRGGVVRRQHRLAEQTIPLPPSQQPLNHAEPIWHRTASYATASHARRHA